METMAQHVYAVYLETYVGALAALHAADDEQLRDLCSQAAQRDGAESLVTMMALSDAGRGRGQRARAEVLQALWRRLAG